MRRALTPLWMTLTMGLLLVASPGHAQGDATSLHAEARAATEEGRLHDAYRALQAAVQESDDAALLLELAEAADHLRIDDVALASYRAFLAAAPGTSRRQEIDGRIEALVRVRAGHDFGATRSPAENYVVDWQGRPIVSSPRAGAPHSELVSWDGSPLGAAHARRPSAASPAARLARPY